MADPILIPVVKYRTDAKLITLSDDKRTIEHEAIWNHCFEALPFQCKEGAWLKGSAEAREWMRVLLAAHGAEIRED